MKKLLLLLLVSQCAIASDLTSIEQKIDKSKMPESIKVNFHKFLSAQRLDDRQVCVKYCYEECDIETDDRTSINDKTKCNKVCHTVCAED